RLPSIHPGRRVEMRRGVDCQTHRRSTRCNDRLRTGTALPATRTTRILPDCQLLEQDVLLLLDDLDTRLPQHALRRSAAVGQPAVGTCNAWPAPVSDKDLIHERLVRPWVCAAHHGA